MRMEANRAVKTLQLSDDAIKYLRVIPSAWGRMNDELDMFRRQYLQKYGDDGGWTQFQMLRDWQFMLHNWNLLSQCKDSETAVVEVLRKASGSSRLLTATKIRALEGRFRSTHDA